MSWSTRWYRVGRRWRIKVTRPEMPHNPGARRYPADMAATTTDLEQALRRAGIDTTATLGDKIVVVLPPAGASRLIAILDEHTRSPR